MVLPPQTRGKNVKNNFQVTHLTFRNMCAPELCKINFGFVVQMQWYHSADVIFNKRRRQWTTAIIIQCTYSVWAQRQFEMLPRNQMAAED